MCVHVSPVRGVDSLLSQTSFQIISCTSFLMLKVEVCKFLSMGTRLAYREYSFNVSLVAYPLFLDVNSCGLALDKAPFELFGRRFFGDRAEHLWCWPTRAYMHTQLC